MTSCTRCYTALLFLILSTKLVYPCDILASCLLLSTIAQCMEQPPLKKSPPLFGIAASPLSASHDMINFLACKYQPLAFIETKTFRDSVHNPLHPYSITYLNNKKQLSWKDLENPLYATRQAAPDDYTNINLANSVGMPSPDLDTIRYIISRTLSLLNEYQPQTKLIFSVHGSSVEGFGTMAQLARELKVPYVSANLSCPNLAHKTGLMYKDPTTVANIISRMKTELGTIPLIIKVGAFKPEERSLMEEVITTVASNGAYAMYGINSIPARILNSDGTPTFGPDRETCGVTGTAIRTLAREFVQNAHEIIVRNKLPLTLFACGGITNHEDFKFFETAGADVILCATSIMCNPTFTFPNKKALSKL
jgi:dihydroorotate dehydrogenase